MHEFMSAKGTTLAQGLQETLEPITTSQVSPSPHLLVRHSAQELESGREFATSSQVRSREVQRCS